MKITRTFSFLLIICITLSAAAQAPDQQVLNPSNNLKGKPWPEYEAPQDQTTPKREWEWSLPIFAQRVIDKGFNLPRPYGLSLIYGNLTQGFDIDHLKVAFSDTASLQDVDFIDFHDTQVNDTTWQVKLDAWLFPFLNIFGIIGQVQGSGTVPLSMAYKDIYNFALPGNPCSVASPPSFCEGYINANAPIKFHGNSVGIGMILAGGYKNWFFAMPVTYVETDVNVSDTNTHALNITPRIGYNVKTTFHGKFGFYLGVNYFDAAVTLSGTYNLPMSGTSIGHDVPVRYSLKENPIDNWNPVAGVNWELSEYWSIIVEIGHSENRDTSTFNFAYRF